MIKALIAGERDPEVLSRFARGRMQSKHAQLVEALTGRFDAHHAELARVLLDSIDALSVKVDLLTSRIHQLLAGIPEAQPPATDGGPPTGAGPVAPLPVIDRLDEVPGIGARAAQVIIAEIGLDMAQFPTAGHLVSWAKVAPRTVQSGPKSRSGKPEKGDRYLKGVLAEVATGAAKTDAFLGERYRRLVRRRGKQRALVAVSRSILVIVWHPVGRPDRPLRRPRAGLLRQAHQQRPPHPQPGPPAERLGPPGHAQTSGLNIA
jgi:transposase